MNELLKFMKDHFSQSGNSIGNPLDCFQDEIIRLVHFLEPMKNVLLLGFSMLGTAVGMMKSKAIVVEDVS